MKSPKRTRSGMKSPSMRRSGMKGPRMRRSGKRPGMPGLTRMHAWLMFSIVVLRKKIGQKTMKKLASRMPRPRT